MATTIWHWTGTTTHRYVNMGGAFHIGCAGQGFHIASRGVPPSGRNLPLPRCKVLVLTLAGRCMSICVYGESRTGKTLWARSLGPHIYCVGLVSGDECMKAQDAEYAVFDDIRGGIKFFPSFKEWLGCQAWVTVKCLYREPKLVKWGKPSIWLSNTDPRDHMENSDIDWMNKNCIFVEVNSAIFHASTE